MAAAAPWRSHCNVGLAQCPAGLSRAATASGRRLATCIDFSASGVERAGLAVGMAITGQGMVRLDLARRPVVGENAEVDRVDDQQSTPLSAPRSSDP